MCPSWCDTYMTVSGQAFVTLSSLKCSVLARRGVSDKHSQQTQQVASLLAPPPARLVLYENLLGFRVVWDDPISQRYRHNVVLLLAHRLPRWPNIKTTLVCLLYTCRKHEMSNQCWGKVWPASYTMIYNDLTLI